MTTLADLQNLYDRNLFLEAFRQSSEYWNPSVQLSSLSTDELILGGGWAGLWAKLNFRVAAASWVFEGAEGLAFPLRARNSLDAPSLALEEAEAGELPWTQEKSRSRPFEKRKRSAIRKFQNASMGAPPARSLAFALWKCFAVQKKLFIGTVNAA